MNESLQVISIFQSIDGEVNSFHQGALTTFLRLAECNLRCKYCFGVRPGRHIPKLTASRGINIKLPEVKVGDKLMTFDDSMALVETEVTYVESREVDVWYAVTIDGMIYFVTPEHPFFTNRGLVETKDLVLGDEILHGNKTDKLSFRMKLQNPMKIKDVVAVGRNGKKVTKIQLFDRNTYAPSVRPKPLTIHTISCAPYNSYLIDYMWVHNCDTTYSFKKGTLMSIDEVFSSIADLTPKKVTITGGEPLLQCINLDKLLSLLLVNDYLVSVETNGTLPIIKKHNNLSWVVDYKLPSSKMENNMFIKSFTELGQNDWVKFVINDDFDFERALEVRAYLEEEGCNAKFAYSPVFGIYPASTLVEKLLNRGRGDEVVSLQLHKIIWPNCGVGEER